MSDVAIDLKAYLARIGYSGPLAPTRECLTALHEAHALAIPFENLDVIGGHSPSLAVADIQAKLVANGRGGYCFEHNTLFSTVLKQVGFHLTPLSARVRLGGRHITRPRAHMISLVDIDGDRYIADVGFGGEALFHPVPFGNGAESRQYHWTYRIVPEDHAWLLQSKRGDSWNDLYVFTLDPQSPIDYEVANYFVSTYPQSPFVRMPMIHRITPEARFLLMDFDFTEDRAGQVSTRRLNGDEERRQVLSSVFGLPTAAGSPLNAR